MSRHLIPLIAYVLAFAAAVGLTWGLFSLQVQLTFDPERSSLSPVLFYAAPLAGAALFQLIFGGITGKWRGWRFWLIAIPAVYLSYFLFVIPAFITGYSSLEKVAAVALSVPFIIGLVALYLTRDRA